MSLISVPSACGVLLLSSQITATDTGWLEHTEITLSAHSDRCDRVTLPLPAQVSLGAHKAKEMLGDGIQRKLPDDAWDSQSRDLKGEGQVVVFLPDLRQGDKASLSFDRHWNRKAPFRWAPAPALHAELQTTASTKMEGAVKGDKKGLWITEATPADGVVLDAPGNTGWSNPHDGLAGPENRPKQSRTLTLEVPLGQPQYTMYPGGGSVLHSQVDLVFQAEDRDRGWVVPMSPNAYDVKVGVRPSDTAAEWIKRDDSLLLVVASSEGPARVSVQWREPDPPTCGEALPHEDLTVLAPGGKIIDDVGNTWFLAGIHEMPVIPARSALVRGLDRRYRSQAIPEPGLPNSLRGQFPSWELAAALVPALNERHGIAHWPSDPLWVRKLVKARKSGGLTPVETALYIWIWSMQAQMPAEWVLVRPATSPTGGNVSPAGYTDMLVRITLDGETRWIDPSCGTCASFEVRTDLLGAQALSASVDTTPPPQEGHWTTVMSDEWVRWELDGPAALALRQWLQTVPEDQQWPALAARMAGEGAELVEAEGVSDPGEPIRVAARGGTEDRTHGLTFDAPDADGSVWTGWSGDRILVEANASADHVTLAGDNWTLTKNVRDGALWTVLHTDSRRLSASDLDQIRAGFAPAIRPAAEDEQPPEGGVDETSPEQDDDQGNPQGAQKLEVGGDVGDINVDAAPEKAKQ